MKPAHLGRRDLRTAYGPHQDPLEALVVTAPYGRTRLVLLWTTAVLVSVLPVTALLGLAIPSKKRSSSVALGVPQT